MKNNESYNAVVATCNLGDALIDEMINITLLSTILENSLSDQLFLGPYSYLPSWRHTPREQLFLGPHPQGRGRPTNWSGQA